MKTKSSNKNMIFFDTEFTHLDPKIGELLSIGMVKEDSEELYLEIDYVGEVHPWVKKKVLPHLTGNKIGKKEAREKITEFVGEGKPYLMAYVNQFDAIYWYDLFKDPKEHPAFWIPLDFASILFAHGYDPESMRKDSFFEMLNIDRAHVTQHNALHDARLLAETYKKFISHISL